MFALDRSLKAIEIAEPNVVAVYHSSFVVNAACPGVGQITCEAYVCDVQEGHANTVYVALIDSVDRTVYVYSDGSDCCDHDSCQETLKDALGFAESLGFTMDPVNLNYGKALREVIIRGIRVFSLLPVGKKTNLSSTIPVRVPLNLSVGGNTRGKNLLAEESPAEETPVSVGNEVTAPEIEPILSITPPLPEGNPEMTPLVREPVPLEDLFAGEIPADGMSSDNLDVSLQQARAAENLAEANVAEAMSAMETASAARLEREKVLAEKNVAEQVLAAQVDAARLAWERTETGRVDSERLLVETVKAEKLAQEKFEEARLALEAAEAERGEREQQLEARAAAEMLAAKSIDTVRLEWENTEAERVEWENLLFQSIESEKQAEEQAASALKELEEAIVVRSKQERLLKTEQDDRSAARLREALPGGAGDDNGGGRPEPVLSGAVLTGDVTEEVSLSESPMTPEPSSSGLSGEQSASEGVAAADTFAGEPAETAQPALAQGVPAPFAEPAASPISSPSASSRPPFESTYGGSPFATDDEESSDSSFAIDYSLQTIELGKDDQVTDYYQSLNTVRLTIENLPSQSSSSYLCAVNRNGIYSVYFALFLTDSRRTIVYCPGQQPGTTVDKEKVIMDGVSFAETVGFIMDRIEPGGRVKQAQLLGSSPVFSLH